MNRSYTAPDDFEPTEAQIAWACKEFNIPKEEVFRQTTLWKEWEYKRAYFDWNRAWKRWFRQAEKYDQLKKNVRHRRPQEVSEAERAEDQRKFEEQIRRFRGEKC